MMMFKKNKVWNIRDMKDVSYRHILKPGTPEHGATEHGAPRNNRIRNTGGTAKHLGKKWKNNEIPRNTSGTPAEHPGIPTERQSNTTGTPRNNGTILNEEQL